MHRPGQLQPGHPQRGVVVVGQRALGAVAGRRRQAGRQRALLQGLLWGAHLQDLEHHGGGGVLQVGHGFAPRHARQVHAVHVEQDVACAGGRWVTPSHRLTPDHPQPPPPLR